MIKWTVEDRDVIRTLRALPPKLNEQVRKKSIRAAARPYIAKLKAAWRAESFGGKGKVRRAIASTTKLDGPKRRGGGNLAPLTFGIGVDYAGKSGKGRQRLWHLLERGFMHKGANRRIPGRLVSTRWVQANGVRMARRIQEEILIHAAKLTGGRS
jgi:hypothetical protein